MTGPRFDYTLNIGHIVTLLAVGATVIAAWTTINGRVEGLEQTEVRQEARLKDLELSDIDVGKTIAEMRTDVRYIREYVADMKAEQRRTSIKN